MSWSIEFFVVTRIMSASVPQWYISKLTELNNNKKDFHKGYKHHQPFYYPSRVYASQIGNLRSTKKL